MGLDSGDSLKRRRLPPFADRDRPRTRAQHRRSHLPL
jgi:hypothetical protein